MKKINKELIDLMLLMFDNFKFADGEHQSWDWQAEFIYYWSKKIEYLLKHEGEENEQ